MLPDAQFQVGSSLVYVNVYALELLKLSKVLVLIINTKCIYA